MSKKKIIGQCHLCGQTKPLSFEHIPPEKAFNDLRLKAYTFEQLIGNRSGSKTFQHGYGDYTLCECCNNNTGSWYGRAYVDFVYQAMENRATKKFDIENGIINDFSIYPLRVFKQILTMFFTVNYPEFQNKYPWLRDYILNKENTCYLDSLKLFVYYVEDMQSVRISPGVLGTIDTETRITAMFSEFAYPPLGYILSYDDVVLDPRLVNITGFSNYKYDEKATFQLNVFPLPIANTFYGEFRTPEEIQRQNL